MVCADNALPHLLTAAGVRAALAEMLRVLRPGGLLLLSARPPALPEERTAAFAAEAGFVDTVWHAPADTGFHQPVLVARRRSTG
ncbi:hypothetical protein ACODT3_29350 [Streptomyces sp. 4.24]|uniref:hypothetical protein n=1 Tax=Streptomyces tritrimontium TaxID=3406573 RepID=UPI003BB6FC8A